MAYFILDNSSPEVIYSPFADSFQQPDLLQGWNPYFSISGFPSVQGQIGIGTGFHLTSLNGATLSIQWHGMLFTPHTISLSHPQTGTAIQLFGNATQASYSITLDGYPTQPNSSLADSVLAHLTDLPSTNHNLSLSVQIPSPTSNNSFLAFQNAAISATSATGSKFCMSPFITFYYFTHPLLRFHIVKLLLSNLWMIPISLFMVIGPLRIQTKYHSTSLQLPVIAHWLYFTVSCSFLLLSPPYQTLPFRHRIHHIRHNLTHLFHLLRHSQFFL